MINTVYKINDTTLLKAISNTDLGVEIDSFLTFDQHIVKTCNKAKQRAAIILKCFKSRNPALLVKAFIPYVRSILEYACNVWSPFKLIHIDKLKHVQRYSTRRLKRMYNLSNGERLLNLCLESLEVRRLRSDLLMYFKTLHGYADLQFTDFFKINNNRTTINNFLAITSSWKTNFSSDLFSNRAINVWNSLSNDIVLSQSVNQFK